MFPTPIQLVQAVGQWHVYSQQVARQNALAASTALARRRRELDEVELFLAARTASAASGSRPTLEEDTPVPTERVDRGA